MFWTGGNNFYDVWMDVTNTQHGFGYCIHYFDYIRILKATSIILKTQVLILVSVGFHCCIADERPTGQSLS